MGTSDGTRLVGQRWTVDGEPRAALVLVHGMGEHSLRYDRLGKALAATGIEVLAVDQRGHGRTAGIAGEALGSLGKPGWDGLASDLALVVRSTRGERPEIPIVVLGHSMGSWVVQQYLLEHSEDDTAVVAAVLSGTAALDQLATVVDPTKELDLTAFNAPFAPARTDYDWLSRDEREVDDYVAEPLCGFGLDSDGATGMVAAAPRLADPSSVRTGLPVYVIAGSADPVNAGMAWLQPLLDRYRAAGVEVTTAVYEGGRHEMFNETNRDEVVADLITWLNARLP